MLEDTPRRRTYGKCSSAASLDPRRETGVRLAAGYPPVITFLRLSRQRARVGPMLPTGLPSRAATLA